MAASTPAATPGIFKGLKLYNTIGNAKVDFVPRHGNEVRWYICGPTVYDDSHMGHARTYLAFDIIRRVLEDYFNYDLFCVMNVTDIDDKIILRARQQYLFEQFSAEKPSITPELLTQVQAAMDSYKFAERRAVLEAGDPTDTEVRAKLALLTESEIAGRTALMNASTSEANGTDSGELLSATRDVLSTWLDAEYGSGIEDHSIFDALSKRMEAGYLADMAALGVRPHHVLTRVSEYVPEIIALTERIIASGAGYASNGSVYFDTVAFQKSGHNYCKCAPHKRGNAAALSEGEGSLTTESSEKRHPNDFVLWKKSKSGEPRWASPWGDGRPGWHIECSAMAGTLLGDYLDIHGGGEDLKFPHHDNELAQSEAAFGVADWVGTFLHTGHLHIAGAKMSKSLKNFVTIKQALAKYSARQIRLLFLLHTWAGGLDYSDASMVGVRATEKRLKEFFYAAASAMLAQTSGVASQKWGAADIALNTALRTAKAAVDAALKDSMDFPTAMAALMDIVGAANRYVVGEGVHGLALHAAASYVAKILAVFGVIETVGGPEAGYGFNVAAATGGADSQFVRDLLSTVAGFRDTVRAAVIAKAPAATVLGLCDDLRDESLPEIGVRLEDTESGRAAIKVDDRETLLAERAERHRVAAAKDAKKGAAAAAAAEKQAAKLAKMAVNPADMFRDRTDEFSEWGADGMPTKDKAGAELSKNALKKLGKERDKQAALYRAYVEGGAAAAAAAEE